MNKITQRVKDKSSCMEIAPVQLFSLIKIMVLKRFDKAKMQEY